MINALKKLIELVDRFTDWTGRAVSWLTVVLVIIICYDVIMRYLFNSSSVAIYELEWHIFALIFLLGAGYALQYDKHVRVDVLYSKFPERAKAWVNLIGTLLLLLPFCLILIAEGFDFVSHSFMLGESSPDPGGLPFRYLIKAAIPLGVGILFLQGISQLLKNLLVIIAPANNHSSS